MRVGFWIYVWCVLFGISFFLFSSDFWFVSFPLFRILFFFFFFCSLQAGDNTKLNGSFSLCLALQLSLPMRMSLRWMCAENSNYRSRQTTKANEKKKKQQQLKGNNMITNYLIRRDGRPHQCSMCERMRRMCTVCCTL